MFCATSEVQEQIMNHRSIAWTMKTLKASAVSCKQRNIPSPYQQGKKMDCCENFTELILPDVNQWEQVQA